MKGKLTQGVLRITGVLMFNDLQKLYNFCGSFQVLRKTKEDRQEMNKRISAKAQITPPNKKS